MELVVVLAEALAGRCRGRCIEDVTRRGRVGTEAFVDREPFFWEQIAWT